MFVTEAENGSPTGKRYEINLDKRKLKTPGGRVLSTDSELLAQMIAHEWRSQAAHIKLNTMHLTSLTNTTLDNPNKVTQADLTRNIHDYLATDTLLFFDTDPTSRLLAVQEREWRPLVDWFNTVFDDARLRVSRGDLGDDTPGTTEPATSSATFASYLTSNFTLSTLIGFNYLVECVKSVILSVALLERRVDSVDRSLALTLLEESHQWENWGKVEWYHDIHEQVRLFPLNIHFTLLTTKKTYKILL